MVWTDFDQVFVMKDIKKSMNPTTFTMSLENLIGILLYGFMYVLGNSIYFHVSLSMMSDDLPFVYRYF